MQRFRTCFLFKLLMGLTVNAWAQSVPPGTTLAQVLQSVEQTNKTLLAERQYGAARKVEYRTGLNPDNPFVEYDRLPGRPETAGIQQEISLTQALDFPTVYARRRAVARQLTGQTDTRFRVIRQSILLEAKQTSLEIIYYNRRQLELQRRLGRAEQLVRDWSKKLQQGEATALDLNKVRLQRLGAEHELRLNQSEQRQRLQRLAELNGGTVIALRDTLYPALPPLANFPTLDSLIEAGDPTLSVLQQQIGIGQAQVALSRSLTLPKLEVGYHYQAILGQRYQGVHLGLTLPLWQQAQTVNLGKANVLESQARLTQHRTEHYAQNQRLYEQYQTQQASLNQYRELFSQLSTLTLLDTSLRLGQITTVEYLLETTYLYAAQDTYQQLERDVQLAAAELLRYQL
ncbi:TolC family protein [Larkinella punicea]|uniref:TolC family protein n=1 Tax=Larkinella punicea TaxID=2315727 RepID=A0A368JK88_9BACT|nr:TolC family protein [Larkinella punicea]RCR67466.1 TolC family protein [Larkinella punicea]